MGVVLSITNMSTRAQSLDEILEGGPNTLILPKLAAPILKSSVATLARWRSQGKGPVPTKLSRSKVAYRAADILAYLEAGRTAA